MRGTRLSAKPKKAAKRFFCACDTWVLFEKRIFLANKNEEAKLIVFPTEHFLLCKLYRNTRSYPYRALPVQAIFCIGQPYRIKAG